MSSDSFVRAREPSEHAQNPEQPLSQASPTLLDVLSFVFSTYLTFSSLDTVLEINGKLIMFAIVQICTIGRKCGHQIFIVAQMIITELESFSNDIEFLHELTQDVS